MVLEGHVWGGGGGQICELPPKSIESSSVSEGHALRVTKF